MCHCRYIVIFIILISVQAKNDRTKQFGPRVSSSKLLQTWNRNVQQKIVYYHNLFRTRVSPRASDMLLMKWHPVAANAAQKWAEKCNMMNYDSVKGRWVKRFGSCGQNLFISPHQVPWYFPIKNWFMERHEFIYGSKNNSLIDVGHYTQMVWAASHKVGCGFSKCTTHIGKTYYLYVCNYCPTGNKVGRLEFPYKSGEPCGECPSHCRNKTLCTNACQTTDMWQNCQEIYNTWPDWLCSNNNTEEKKRFENCKATCRCKDRIK